MTRLEMMAAFEQMATMMRAGVTTADQMATEIGVSARTVYRYIKLMRAGGSKIRGEAGFGYVIDDRRK